MVNHGLSTGALFLCVGVIYERRHTRLLADYGGLAKTMPVFATFFIISMLFQRYRLSLVPGTDVCPKVRLSIQFRDGPWMRIHKREASWPSSTPSS